MPKSNAANVIDLETFRQRKMREERQSGESAQLLEREASPAGVSMVPQMVVPLWVCWVPMWSPILG
jgi:hypothetical protein